MKKVIGIDLGGTKILASIVDEGGNLERTRSVPSEGARGRDIVLKNIRGLIDELMTDEILAIGIGSPGFIDVDRGRVLFASDNIRGWTGTHVVDELKQYYDLPIFLANDANMAALCEAWMGSGRKLNSFVMLTLGTGVGGVIYSKEKGLWLGHRFEGGELGHSIIYPNGRECGCGQRGCADQYVSGKGIKRNYYDLTARELKAEEIFGRLEADRFAYEAVDKFIDDLVILLINIKNILDPQGVIIGGGVINSKEYWWEDMLERYSLRCNSKDRLEIVAAEYLNNSGVIGAGKMALMNL